MAIEASEFSNLHAWCWTEDMQMLFSNKSMSLQSARNYCQGDDSLRVVHTRALRIWMENFFFDFNFFLSKISRSDRGSNLRSFDFESFSTRLLKPLSYRANQNYSKTNRFYTKQICVGFFHFALFVISCIVKIEFNSF